VHSLHLSYLHHIRGTSFFQHLTILHELRIESCLSSKSSGVISIPGVQSLGKLFINDCNALIKSPLMSLTAPDLHRVRADTCVALLIQCPNLISFRGSDPVTARVPFSDDNKMDKSVLILQSLEYFFLDALSHQGHNPASPFSQSPCTGYTWLNVDKIVVVCRRVIITQEG
jgi:hypothetical protein